MNPKDEDTGWEVSTIFRGEVLVSRKKKKKEIYSFRPLFVLCFAQTNPLSTWSRILFLIFYDLSSDSILLFSIHFVRCHVLLLSCAIVSVFHTSLPPLFSFFLFFWIPVQVKVLTSHQETWKSSVFSVRRGKTFLEVFLFVPNP